MEKEKLYIKMRKKFMKVKNKFIGQIGNLKIYILYIGEVKNNMKHGHGNLKIV